MTFLPLIERELRLRARSPAAYWMRFVVALAGVLICLPQLTSWGSFGTPATVGQGVFNGLVGAGFLLICGVCLLTADALNAEQREGTIGLLLLTRVRVLDVLLGKLGSIGITSVCVLVALLPMLMLPVLAGGVTGGEAFRKGFGLVNILFFALASGLYASAAQRERFKAALLAMLIVLTVVLAPLLLGLIKGHAGPKAAFQMASRLSPIVLLTSAGSSPYRASASPYWISMASLSALSCLLLVGACIRLRRSVREDESKRATPREVPANTEAGVAQPRRRHPFDGEANPVAWRVGRQRGLKATLWAAALVGFLWYLLFGFIGRFVRLNSVVSISWSFWLASQVVVGSLCAWAASRFFVESRRTGELELLLTTPVGAQTIVSDQWEVLKRLLRWPVVLMLAPMVLQVPMIFVFSRGGPGGYLYAYFVLSLVAGAINTVLGLAALCWLALWFGLRTGGQAKAILWSIAVAKGVPYCVSLVTSLIAPLIPNLLIGRLTGPPPALSWIIWLLPQAIDAVLYLWMIRLARRRLRGDLALAPPLPFNLRRAVSSTWRDALLAFRKARHWTPS